MSTTLDPSSFESRIVGTTWRPTPTFSRRWDPFVCKLLSEEHGTQFTIPIVRIVFALGGEKTFVQQQIYASPKDGAVTPDANEHLQLPEIVRRKLAQFTSYDIWCSGLDPSLLQPVDESDARTKWEALLDKTDTTWGGVFSKPKAPGVRRSQYPAGGTDLAHYGGWIESYILLESVRPQFWIEISRIWQTRQSVGI